MQPFCSHILGQNLSHMTLPHHRKLTNKIFYSGSPGILFPRRKVTLDLGELTERPRASPYLQRAWLSWRSVVPQTHQHLPRTLSAVQSALEARDVAYKLKNKCLSQSNHYWWRKNRKHINLMNVRKGESGKPVAVLAVTLQGCCPPHWNFFRMTLS